jgi:hypothetical protein
MSTLSSAPLLDQFRRGDVPQDVRLLVAQGAVGLRPLEQLLLLLLLTKDAHPDVRAAAEQTLSSVPRHTIAALAARSDTSDELRRFCAQRGVEPAAAPAPAEEPLVDSGGDEGGSPDDASEAEAEPAVPLSMLPIKDKVKLAMRGSREQRSQLVRDPNKLVSCAVLSSPKLTEAEVEAFTRMGNVSEEVLRIIGTNRTWVKNYGIMAGLAKNPKTPLTVSLHLIPHLNVRDIKLMAMDRNLPEQVRLGARKIMARYGQK